MIDETLIQACLKANRKAQHTLYIELSPMLYSTCKRYLKQVSDVEDVLADAFVQIFTKLNSLKDVNAIHGWAKRITVNQCLQFLRKKVNFNLSLEDLKQEPVFEKSNTENLEHKELLGLLEYLPEGCKSVFNLFAIEGFSHKDIAEMLQISEGTSKSQLNVARTKLQQLVKNRYDIKFEKNGIAK